MNSSDGYKFERLSWELESRLAHMNPGDVFPGVRQIMRDYDVSQATAYKGLEVLKGKGLIGSNERGRLIVASPSQAGQQSLRVAFVSAREESPYQNAVIQALVEIGRKVGMRVTVCPLEEDALGDIANWGKLYDGFLVVPGRHPISPQVIARWDSARLPVVVLDCRLSGLDVSCVSSNNYFAGLLAARHFIQMGHKKMAVFLNESGVSALKERADGFRDEASLSKDVSVEIFTNPQPLLGADQRCAWMEAELAKRPDVTALFALTHTASLALLRTLYTLQRRVPDEVSVIGFDNLHSSGLSCPPMTTIDQEIDQMVRAACEQLREQFCARGQTLPVKQVVIRPQLVVRNSTASIV